MNGQHFKGKENCWFYRTDSSENKLMQENKKMLHSVWDQSSDSSWSEKGAPVTSEYNGLIHSLFCPGPSYYYVLDSYDQQIKEMSQSVETILGLDYQSVGYDAILQAMHPDDLEFVTKAKDKAYQYIYNVLRKEDILNYKVSYCFRSKNAHGVYQLFNNQTIVLAVDDRSGFERSLNIHTNIDHLTTVNSHKIYLIHMIKGSDIIELEVTDLNVKTKPTALFSKREAGIIKLITQGFTNDQIAEQLFLSPHTVKNHRKKILKKAGVRNSAALIIKCMKNDLLTGLA